MAEEIHSSDAPLHVREGVGEQARAQGTFAHSPVLGGRAVQLEAVLAPWVKDPDLLPRPGPRHLDGTHEVGVVGDHDGHLVLVVEVLATTEWRPLGGR